MYETANETYKLLINIYSVNRNYQALSRVHGELKGVFDDIIKAESMSARSTGSFYRLVYFGSKFEDLDGKEYIIRERPYTQLPELCERLEVAIFIESYLETIHTTIR
jgi:hypothetical protein